jgi:hypothetical protein
MFCPSSSLPPLVLTSTAQDLANIQSSTYVGISGALDHATTRNMASGGGGGASGKVSFGGALIRNRGVAFAEISDGASNTMLVAEQSGWCAATDGSECDCRSDCGHGFPMGFGTDGWDRDFNLTCVVHPIGETSYNALGVEGNCGPNRPIQSAHPTGATALLGDGSVRFLSKETNIQTLYNLANRDDGKTPGNF